MNTVPRSSEALQPPSIVIVEDDASNATMLALTLQLETSYSVRTFLRGIDLLAHLDEIRANPPVLFLFDYRLPTMTGIDLYDRLAQVEECAHIPVILLTAAFPFSSPEVIANRPISVIEKPFDIDVLLQTISRLTAPLLSL